MPGKGYFKGGTLPRLTLYLDRSVERCHKLVHHVQAQPKASIMILRDRPGKPLKDALLIRDGNPDPMIPHHKPHGCCIARYLQLDRLAPSVLDRIG